jgi:hypothetical protein
MCSNCEPTFDGYMHWEPANFNTFTWLAKPSDTCLRVLQSEVNGPIELDIPYI